ncbi:hypothetical protein [Porphyromonas sp. COT-290 OH3588]|uniref:hypothetical protein n=1 Tax=Porphyromonas sp. COT-290 OH3588 TaxID=1515617 RepID=UPI000A672EAC|nr:hypothetical protein [Porphyromonas sp. COT-290 OH3588]
MHNESHIGVVGRGYATPILCLLLISAQVNTALPLIPQRLKLLVPQALHGVRLRLKVTPTRVCCARSYHALYTTTRLGIARANTALLSTDTIFVF